MANEAIEKSAAIGGGVIGGGWIARWVLNGVDVKVFDPSPAAERVVGEVLANAERAYAKLTLAPPAPKGKLEFVGSIAEAVAEAQLVQESVPERLDLKRSILNEVDRHAPADALICSSTSGLLPTQLQADLHHPERMLVGHPFNPVYLLPLVEICGGEQTSSQAQTRAAQFYRDIGMQPLILRKEIDAFLADRLLEAVWREGLWLVNDDVATTAELDDAIRFGFGLRWAQMGLFETYRIAGGEAGMRHFIAQFGPTLKWPWSKLTDVPDLTEALIDKIAEQSDAQSGRHSIRELERIRDDNLIAIMQGLKTHDWGAGAVLRAHEARLYERAHPGASAFAPDLSQPLRLHDAKVRADWVDYNNHMTESRYLQVFGDATDAFLRLLGMDKDYLARGLSIYTVETHLRHLREVSAGEPLAVSTQLLGYDEKRIRIVHVMSHPRTGAVLATAEHMLLHVNTRTARACPAEASIIAQLDAIWAGHKDLEAPDYAGRGVRAVNAERGPGRDPAR